MRRAPCVTCVLVVLAACGAESGSPDAGTGVGRCDPAAPVQHVAAVEGLNTELDELGARLLPDERTVVFSRGAAGRAHDLYIATRSSPDAPFDPPVLLATVNSVSSDDWPALSPDGRLLAFVSDRGTGVPRIYTSRRDTASGAFGPPAAALALVDRELQPMIANERALYFASGERDGLGGRDIWRAELDGTGATGVPVHVIGGVNTNGHDEAPAITADERVMFFARVSGDEADIYTASRSSTTDGFGLATAVDGLAVPQIREIPTWVSADGCRLYFHSDAPGGHGGYDLYVAVRDH